MLLALKLASIVLLFMVVFVFYLILLNPTAITTTTSSSLSSLTLKSTSSSVAALSSSSSKRIPKNNNNNSVSIMATMIAPTVVPNLLSVESPKDPAKAAAMIHKQGLRGSYHPLTTTATATSTTSTTTAATTTTKKDKTHLSLWLIPPGGEAVGTNDDADENEIISDQQQKQHKHNVYQSAQQLVNELATQYNGPTFIPHVTIVGGIEVESEEEARQLSKKLQEGLSKTSYYVDSSTSGGSTRTRTNTPTGSIDCHFKARLVSEPSCWNQALIVEMEPSHSFVKLCERSRQLLGMEQPQPQPQKGEQKEQRCSSCLSFPPPARVPHMSLYYGVPPNIPDPSTIDVSRIFGNSDGDSSGAGGPTTTSSHRSFHFQAHRVMVVHTDPSTVDGVLDWRIIADIDLSS